MTGTTGDHVHTTEAAPTAYTSPSAGRSRGPTRHKTPTSIYQHIKHQKIVIYQTDKTPKTQVHTQCQ